jgi:heterodisulfide reductase subunit A
MVEGMAKKRLEFDFVILAAGVEPDRQLHQLAGILGLDQDPHGFLKERHPTWGAIETTVAGIFMAGGTQGPKDIPECVSQASGAAARVLAMLHRLNPQKAGASQSLPDSKR